MSALTPEVLQELWDRSPKAARALFMSTFADPEAEARPPDEGHTLRRPDLAAALLRVAQGRLDRLGMTWSATPWSQQQTTLINKPWRQLTDLLRARHRSEDGLEIFGALVASIPWQSAVSGGKLMTVAFDQPQWRLAAIERHPALFLGQMETQESPNPYLLLAGRRSRSTPRNLQTLETTLQALEAIGVPSGIDEHGRGPLSLAAQYQDAVTLEVFARHFREMKDAPDAQGNTPLHHAAATLSAANLLVLVQCDADPRLANHAGETPLVVAANSSAPEAVDCTRVLLESHAYSDEDVRQALTLVEETMASAFIRAYRARDIIANVGASIDVRPL